MNRSTYSEINRYAELGKIINKKIIELTNNAKELIERIKAEVVAIRGENG